VGKSELLRVQKALSLLPFIGGVLQSFFGFCEKTSSFQNREREIFAFDSCLFLSFFFSRLARLAPHNSLLSFPFFSSLTKACNNVRARRRKKKKKKTRRRKRRGRKRRGKRDERGDRVRENLGVLLCVYIFIHTFFLLSLRCYCFRENVKLTKSFL